MSAIERAAAVLAETWCVVAHSWLELRSIPGHEDPRLHIAACFACQEIAGHVAAELHRAGLLPESETNAD